MRWLEFRDDRYEGKVVNLKEKQFGGWSLTVGHLAQPPNRRGLRVSMACSKFAFLPHPNPLPLGEGDLQRSLVGTAAVAVG